MAYSKEYYQKNKEKFRESKRKWNKKNPDWRKRSLHIKEYNRKYYKNRYRNNPKVRIDSSMRVLMWLGLKEKKSGLKWEKLAGYTAQDLMEHLEALFDDKMSWDNYGSYWEIDHIKPRSLFSLEEFKDCWALNNLQPLEVSVNRRKNNKYKVIK